MAAGALATTFSPLPRATSTTGQDVSAGRSGRMEPPSTHDEVGGRKTPPPTAHGHDSGPSRPARRPPGPGGTGVNPSAIPSGAGLFFIDVPATGTAYSGFHAIGGREVQVSVVRGSKYCPLS
jgi:hypothetical protein